MPVPDPYPFTPMCRRVIAQTEGYGDRVSYKPVSRCTTTEVTACNIGKINISQLISIMEMMWR